MTHSFISKTRLARKFFPELTPDSARHKLMSLLDNPRILAKLTEAGYTPRCRSFSPRMQELVYEYLGRPE